MAKGTDATWRRPRTADPSARRRVRANADVLVALALMAGVEIVGLRNGTLGLLTVAAIVLVVGLLVVTRFSMVNIALGATYAAAFTLTWNGWFVGPVRPGDAFALVAIPLFIAARVGLRAVRLPFWVLQMAGLIALVAAINLMFPPDIGYIASRNVLRVNGTAAVSEQTGLTSANITVALKFIVAVAALPFVFVSAASCGRHVTRRLVVFFAVGSATSGWVAIGGLYGLNTLNRVIGTVVPGVPRQIGLSNQPNYLAAAVVLALPIGVWLAFEPARRSRLAGMYVIGGCVLGAYASGSRGGAVCTVLAIAVSVVLIPRARRFALMTLVSALALANAAYLILPSVARTVLRATRLVGAEQTTGPSDQARGILADQALLDFFHSPIHGIGLQVSFDAQTVYLQILQSGGVLLMIGLVVYNAGAIVTASRMISRAPLAAALCASIVSSLALNVFEANLTDRYYYIPIAAVAALHHTLSRSAEPPGDQPVAAAPAGGGPVRSAAGVAP